LNFRFCQAFSNFSSLSLDFISFIIASSATTTSTATTTKHTNTANAQAKDSQIDHESRPRYRNRNNPFRPILKPILHFTLTQSLIVDKNTDLLYVNRRFIAPKANQGFQISETKDSRDDIEGGPRATKCDIRTVCYVDCRFINTVNCCEFKIPLLELRPHRNRYVLAIDCARDFCSRSNAWQPD